ncbi:tetratricopeptide repeat protein [uncultured Roseivirga sp.]|uniref:tetratricopeptide repeat protein n=1 Tax=uncultured Roseivirga sp. TaxID=543088 RepID=UPI000D7B0C13|nr:tetratricopeptide repeat protein [uncultured Roseivirga sp.]PWL29887.1 MAG: cytochrome C biosynthesis protein [Roseivirga sp. XM-24bin3]
MAENNSSEERNSKDSSAIEKFKNEVGPIGFIGAIVGLIVLVVASGLFFLDYRKDQRNIDAQNEIFQAQYYYENDSLEFALMGDGRNLGFIDIIDIYGGTEVANLASFYAGASYLKQRQYEQAIDYLEDFSTSEILVQGRAYSLIGDAYLELGNFSDAADNYERAANTVDDQYFSPGYLLKASLAYEKGSDLSSAIESLDKIINDYAKSTQVNEARKQKARLEVLAGR